MSYIKTELEHRNIPDVLTFKNGSKLTNKDNWEKRRLEMVKIIAENMFGEIPPSYPIEIEEEKFSDKYLGQKIIYKKIVLKIETPNGVASFPIYQCVPKNKINIPMFVHIAFKPKDVWRSTPIEQIIDRGYGIVLAYNDDITSDDGDFSNGVAKFFPKNNVAKYHFGHGL